MDFLLAVGHVAIEIPGSGLVQTSSFWSFTQQLNGTVEISTETSSSIAANLAPTVTYLSMEQAIETFWDIIGSRNARIVSIERL